MSNEKPVILIIGGGWHKPHHYGKLQAALEAAGHEVHCPAHPSMNEARPPTASLAEDSSNIREFAEKLIGSGRRIVAIVHSYGGQIGTDALHGLGLEERKKRGESGGVVNIVYMCAFALPVGGSSKNNPDPVLAWQPVVLT